MKVLLKLLAIAVLGGALVAGCGHGGESSIGVVKSANLTGGYWKENCSMGFEISQGGTQYVEWANAIYRRADFKGDIVGSPDLSALSGYLTVRVTESSDPAAVGRYARVRWSDFNEGTVKKRVATDTATGKHLFWDTQAQADAIVADGYFQRYCCPYAVHYSLPRVTGAVWKASNGAGAFSILYTTLPTGSQGLQFTQYDSYTDATTNTVRLKGTVDRSQDFTVTEGYLRILVTNSGTSEAAVGEYTVVAWENLAENRVDEAVATRDGRVATTAVKDQALLDYTKSGGYFTFASYGKTD